MSGGFCYIREMVPRVVFAWLLIFFGLAMRLHAADYAGQYILKLGTRNFLAVNLTQEKGVVSGTISLPRQFDFDAGKAAFSHISQETRTEPITSVTVFEGRLQLTTENPKDTTDSTVYDFKLLPSDHASIRIASRGIGPWVLIRVPTLPALTVATDWDPNRSYRVEEDQ